MRVNEIFEKFTSGNDVEVQSATITKEELTCVVRAGILAIAYDFNPVFLENDVNRWIKANTKA